MLKDRKRKTVSSFTKLMMMMKHYSAATAPIPKIWILPIPIFMTRKVYIAQVCYRVIA